MKLYITPKPPYNFSLVASLYARFPSQAIDLYERGAYLRALKIKDRIHLIEVKSVGSIEKPRLLVEVTPDSKYKEEIAKTVKWILGGNEDLGGFYKKGLKDKKFSKIIKDLHGLKPPKTPTIYEALIIAISEQQIALPVAITLRERLVEKYGESIKVNGKRYFTFPEPEMLAKAKVEDIRNLKFSTKKSEYLVDISKKVSNGEIKLESMKNWSVEKVIENLTKYRGIGPWTVEYMMCRGMGRYDALPAGDVGLRNSLTKFLGRNERVTEQETREFLEHFVEYKGNVAFYLIYKYAFEKHKVERF